MGAFDELSGFSSGANPIDDYLLRMRLKAVLEANTPPMAAGFENAPREANLLGSFNAPQRPAGLLGRGSESRLLLADPSYTPETTQPRGNLLSMPETRPQGNLLSGQRQSVDVQRLPTLPGMSDAPSDPPLSMPMVGRKGIAPQGGSVYSDPRDIIADQNKPGALERIGNVLGAVGFAVSPPERQLAMMRVQSALNERRNSGNWDALLGEMEKSGTPKEVLSMARYLGPYEGGKLLEANVTKGLGRTPQEPDLVNLYDNEQKTTFGTTKQTAATLMSQNPNRFAIAGNQGPDESHGTETEREIKRLTAGGMGDDDARDLAYGRTKLITDPVTGAHSIFNLRTGRQKPLSAGGGQPSSVPLSPAPAGVPQPQPARVPAAPPQQAERTPTLWEDTDATGLVPAIQAGASAISGQVGGPVASDVIAKRQRLVNGTQGLVRSLANNSRFPVAEMEAIKKEISITPDVLDSSGSMRARMTAIDQSLSRRYQNEIAAANNPNLPVETRQAASQAANDIGNFLQQLGVPKGGSRGSQSRAGNGAVPRGGSPGQDASGAPLVPGAAPTVAGLPVAQMSKEQLSKLDPKRLSAEENKAAALRWEELAGGQ